MEIHVGITNHQQANLFLRALWSVLRENFGKCSWQSTPYKDGVRNMVFIGFADINRPEGTVEVSISYTERGTIHSIFFGNSKSPQVDPKSELGILLKRSVDSAITKLTKLGRHVFATEVEGLHITPRFYRGDSFCITPISTRRFKLELSVSSFDHTDAKPLVIVKMRHVLNILSAETNSAFWPILDGQLIEDWPLANQINETEVFTAAPDWIDDIPIQDEQFLISEKAKLLIDTVAGDRQISENVEIFLRACNHFHIARKYAAQKLDTLEFGELERASENEFVIPLGVRDRRLEAAGQMGDAHAEITSTLFMSAMEVASKIGMSSPESCKECGQLRYKISQRVTDLMQECGGDTLVRVAKGYYAQRSQYLHEGIMLSPMNYTGVSIPQLDPSSPTGCLVQAASPDPNLKDYVGYCLRKTMKAII